MIETAHHKVRPSIPCTLDSRCGCCCCCRRSRRHVWLMCSIEENLSLVGNRQSFLGSIQSWRIDLRRSATATIVMPTFTCQANLSQINRCQPTNLFSKQFNASLTIPSPEPLVDACGAMKWLDARSRKDTELDGIFLRAQAESRDTQSSFGIPHALFCEQQEVCWGTPPLS
jgi:hypothetical protein